MIPKTIHYCWFGGNPLPKFALKCIKSWRKYCPDYQIIRWDESNFDIAKCPRYVQEAYSAKKWAFVTDYVRLQVVYEHGGIYLDTDVTLLKNLDTLLNHSAFFGREDDLHVNTGLGFGAEKGSEVLKELMLDYQSIPFILENGKMDLTPCPARNTNVLLRRGLRQDNTKQLLNGEILILPTEYFCPIDYKTGKKHITKNTFSIHHFSASWHSAAKQETRRKLLRQKKKEYILHTPYRVARKLLGNQLYEKIRCKMKGEK